MTPEASAPDGHPRARRIAGALVRHRRLTFWLALLGTLVLGAGVGRLQFDFSPDRMYPSDDPSRVALDAYRDAFPRHDGRAVVLIEGRGDLLRPDSLRALRALADEFAALPSVDAVESLSSARILHATAEEIVIGPVLEEGSERLRVDREALLEEAFLADRLVGPGGSWLAIEVDLVPEQNTDLGRFAFRDALVEVVDRHRDAFERLTLTGVPVLQAGYMDLSSADQGVLLPLMVLLAIALLYAVLRDRLDAVLPVGIMLMASLWMMGGMGWAGAPMSFLSAAMPVVLLVIGVSDVLHVMAAHERARLRAREDDADERIVERALTDTLSACAMTSLTTAIGFAAIAATGIPMLVDFGLFTGFGVLVTYGLSMALIPNVLLRRGRARASKARMIQPRLEAAFERLGASIARRPVTWILGTLAVGGIGAAGTLRVSTETLMFDDLMPGTELRQSIDRVDEHYGVLSVGVWVHGDGPDGIATADGFARVDAVARAMEEIPELRGVLSPADGVAEVHRAFLPGARERLPTDDAALRQELLVLSLLAPGLLDSLVVPDRSSARVVARIPDLGSGRTTDLLESLEERLVPLAGDGFRVALAGQTVVAQDVIRKVRHSLASSLGLAFLLIAGLCAVVYRSPGLALLALLPNALTVAVLMGLLGWVGFPLKTSMILVFCIAFGIAVDDTIHVVARFAHARARGEAGSAALRALREAGIPMTWTSLVLAAGFAVLLASRFMGLTQMGGWVGVALVLAWVLDLTLLPASLYLYERRGQPR